MIHDNGDEDWEVTLAETGLETGTGARLHRVRDYVDTDTFILTYGDGLGSVDIGALVDFHRSHGRIGTVTGVHPTSRYGEMQVDGRRRHRLRREAHHRRGLRVAAASSSSSASSSTTSTTTPS